MRSTNNNRAGFTLLELMVAMVLLVTAMTMIVGTFTAVLGAWRRGNEMLEDLHHGDFVMDQLVSGLRSAAYFETSPGKYGFRLDDRESGDYPNDMISWVTSGTAFMPRNDPLTKGLHRLVVTVENNDDGDAAVAIRAYPHLAEDVEDDDPDPWFVSTEVKGLDCRVYNLEDEDWEDEWELTNSIPRLVEITLFMDPIEEYGDPVELKRVVEIPLGSHEDLSKNAIRAPGQAPGGRKQPGDNEENAAAGQTYTPGEDDRGKRR